MAKYTERTGEGYTEIVQELPSFRGKAGELTNHILGTIELYSKYRWPNTVVTVEVAAAKHLRAVEFDFELQLVISKLIID